MSMRLEGEVIRLEGDCHIEEAEALLQQLQAAPGRTVDLSGVRHLHGALLQILLSFRVHVVALPQDPRLREHLGPSLQGTFVVAEGA